MQYSLMIGRFQPFHKGHEALVRKVLDEGKNVCISLRDTPIDEANPYSVNERINMVKQVFPGEIKTGRVEISVIPDIDEVVYGRNVGWSSREIHLDEKTESISATKIREGKL